MKTNIFFTFLLGIVAFSCTHEINPLEDSNNSIEFAPVIISAGISQQETTKVTLGDIIEDEVQLHWEKYDAFDLEIGGNKYEFEVSEIKYNQSQAEFICSSAPTVITPGTYIATYPSGFTTMPVMQSGQKWDIDKYLHMTADCIVKDGDSWDDIAISFNCQAAVLKLSLVHSDFIGKEVHNIAINNNYELIATTSDEQFTGNSEGRIDVYLVVNGGADFSNAAITASCGNNNYIVSMQNAKTIAAGKIYNISKEMAIRTDIPEGSRYIVYKAYNTGIPSGDDFTTMNPIFLSREQNIQDIELKFQLPSDQQAYLFYSEESPKYHNGVIINSNGIVLRWDNSDDKIDNETIISWNEIGLRPSSLMVLRISPIKGTVTINGKTISIPNVRTFTKIKHLFSYYQYIDDGDWEKKYLAVPSGSKLYYAKIWDSNGNLKYHGYADLCEYTDGTMQYAWKSIHNGTTYYEFPKTNFNDSYLGSYNSSWKHFKGGADIR